MNRQEMRLFLDDIIHGLRLNEYLTKEQVKWQHGKKLPVKRTSRQTELSITLINICTYQLNCLKKIKFSILFLTQILAKFSLRVNSQ